MRNLAFILVAAAIGTVVLTLVRAHRIKTIRGNPAAARNTRTKGGIAATICLVLAALSIFGPSLADASKSQPDPPVVVKPQTLDVQTREACPMGIAKKETVFFTKKSPAPDPDDASKPNRYGITPALPKGDPDSLIKVLFGDTKSKLTGYACENANVAAELTLIQPGSVSLTDKKGNPVRLEDINDLAAQFRKDHKAWLAANQLSIKSFSQLVWVDNKVPKAKCGGKGPSRNKPCVNFLVSNPDHEDPAQLGSRLTPVPTGFSGYVFPAWVNDGHTLPGVVLEAAHGWLTISAKDKFPSTPICEPIGTPLYPLDKPASAPSNNGGTDQSSNGTDNGSRGSGNGGGGSNSGGSNNSGGGSNGGSSGGGCGHNCGGGGSTGGGGGSGGCNHGCPGGGGTTTTGGGCHSCHPPSTHPPTNCNTTHTCPTQPPSDCNTTHTCPTQPTTTRPPTTQPTTTQPPTTQPTTTRPPTTVTTTTRPVTTTTLKPPPPPCDPELPPWIIGSCPS